MSKKLRCTNEKGTTYRNNEQEQAHRTFFKKVPEILKFTERVKIS